jgi:glycosyltransferase involved in cell wall biosynthesis
VTARIAEALLDDGWHVIAVARRCELAAHPNLTVVRVPGPARPAALSLPWFFVLGGALTAVRRRGLLHVNGAIVPNRADVCTVHFCHRAFAEVREEYGLRRARRSSVAYAVNDMVVSFLYQRFEHALYRLSRRRRLVAVSGGLARELEAHFPSMAGAIETIPNAVDTHVFHPDPEARRAVRSRLGLRERDLLCAFVGGDWERKGLAIAIEALAQAPDWRLIVVGTGDAVRYGEFAARLRVAGRVLFLGHRPTTAEFFAAADALVLPTAYETSCLVAFEAAATGVPVVTPAVNGWPDEVTSGINGYVVPRTAAAVASCLQLLRSSQRRIAVGSEARNLAMSFSWERAGRAYADLYRRLDAAA